MLSWSQTLFLKINSIVGKNKFRDAVSPNIFSQNFINYSADKAKILYRLLPKEIQQELPADFAPKKKTGLFD